MPLFKVLSQARTERFTVCATTLQILKENSAKKLGLAIDSSTLQVFDDSDGSRIDDDECLQYLADFASEKKTHVVLMVLPPGIQWLSQVEYRPDTPTNSEPGTPLSSRCSSPGDLAESPAPAASNVSTRFSDSSFDQFPSVRKYIAVLQKALEAPEHRRNQSLVRARREVVKALTVKLKDKSLTPGDMKKYCQKIRSGCPEAFSIKIKADAVGDAFPQFIKSLYNAVCYSKGSDGTSKRRGRNSGPVLEDDSLLEPEPDVPLLCVDSNGCAEDMWEPLFNEAEATAFEDKRKALMEYSGMPGSEDDINAKNLFKDSYPLQREHLNSARTSEDWRKVFVSWPVLLKKSFLVQHCNLLLGKNVSQVWHQEIACHDTFLAFMEKYCEGQASNASQLSRCSVMEGYIERCRNAERTLEIRLPITQVTFPLLVGYFREVESNLFLVLDASTQDDYVLEKVKETCHCPLLVVKGSSIFDTDASFRVVIRAEHSIKVSSFIEGMLIVMLSYYAFNISYPKTIHRTLEFIQRFFLRINPEFQSRQEGKKRMTINSLVAKLAGNLADFEASRSRWQMASSNV